MRKYLGFVVVYNLLVGQKNYEEIESVVNGAISSATRGVFKAASGNMIYSFPQDPSVIGASAEEVPIVIMVHFFNPIRNISPYEVADLIRKEFRIWLGSREIVVTIINGSLGVSLPEDSH